MNSKKLKKEKIIEPFVRNDIFLKIYGYFHIFITCVSLYMFYSCSKKNQDYNRRTLLFALCWPHVYIMYISATQGFFYCFSSDELEEDDSSESSEE